MKLPRLWMVAGVLTLALAACGGTTVTQNQPTPTPTPALQNTEASLKDLLASGVPQRCTVTSDNQNTPTNGTVYVKAGKMRGDFTAMVQGKTMQSHMIAMDGVAYTWVEGMSTGFRMSMTKPPATANQAAPDLEKKVPMTCAPWAEDDTQFTLPSTVTFNEVSIPTPGTPPSSGGNDQRCAACNYLQGAQQTQCKTALRCP